MTEHRINPDKITSPIQLLAAWFVALIVLDGAFLTAAGVVSAPLWIPAVLVVAAILNVPLFLGFMFLLQTRFRPEMQTDEHYSKYLKEREKTKSLASEARAQIDAAGLDLADLVAGRKMTSQAADNIRPLLDELKSSVASLQMGRDAEPAVEPDALRALAYGELEDGNWLAAATLLDDYSEQRADDFDANFSRGVAYANARNGDATNVGALRAYNDAVVSAPESLDANYRARLFTYRGAMLKRMRRFEEALADFGLAEPLATDEYETGDLLYNLASTYALKGDRQSMLDVVRRLSNDPGRLSMIRARLGDYFGDFVRDEEFLELIHGR